MTKLSCKIFYHNIVCVWIIFASILYRILLHFAFNIFFYIFISHHTTLLNSNKHNRNRSETCFIRKVIFCMFPNSTQLDLTKFSTKLEPGRTVNTYRGKLGSRQLPNSLLLFTAFLTRSGWFHSKNSSENGKFISERRCPNYKIQNFSRDNGWIGLPNSTLFSRWRLADDMTGSVKPTTVWYTRYVHALKKSKANFHTDSLIRSTLYFEEQEERKVSTNVLFKAYVRTMRVERLVLFCIIRDILIATIKGIERLSPLSLSFFFFLSLGVEYSSNVVRAVK